MNIIEGLVSVIIPCYNMENRINLLLNSILVQTYKKLQIIVVNDGSSDNSKKIILLYKEVFERENIQFDYVFQRNQGLGAAINTGLKFVKGEFFCWPDADDTLTIDSIEKKLNFLTSYPDYAFVRSDAYLFNENNLSHPIGYISHKHKSRFKEENLVEDYIWERNIIFCPGCHMIRTMAFYKINPSMEIYCGRRGQNYQLLLPMLCFYKFGYIDEPLYNYVIYHNSMSRGDDTLEKTFFRYDGLQMIMTETFKSIDISPDLKNEYLHQIEQKYHILKSKAAANFGKKESFMTHFYQIDSKYRNGRMRCLYYIVLLPYGISIYSLMYKIKMKIKQNFTLYKLIKYFT